MLAFVLPSLITDFSSQILQKQFTEELDCEYALPSLSQHIYTYMHLEPTGLPDISKHELLGSLQPLADCAGSGTLTQQMKKHNCTNNQCLN